MTWLTIIDTRMAVLFTLVCVSCREAGPHTRDLNHFRFPDSSALQVTAITRAAMAGVARWPSHAAPFIRMGSISGEDAFGKLTAAMRLPDGRYIGADAFRNQILVFDRSGRFDGVWGRGGAGPAEFQWPLWLGVCEQGLVYVYDVIMGRLHAFEFDGTLANVNRLFTPPNNQPPEALTCNENGMFSAVSRREYPELREGPHRELVTLVVGNAEQGFTEVARIAGRDRYRYSTGDGPMRIWGRFPSIAMTSDRIFAATGDAYEIASYSFDGVLENVVRAEDVPRTAVTLAEIREERDRQVSNQSLSASAKRRLYKTFNGMIFPAFHPVIKGLIVDSRGCLWAMDGHPTHPRTRWRVFDLSGEPVGMVDMSSKFTLFQVDEDILVGRETDENEVDFLVAYRYQERDDRRCDREL